MNDDAPHPPTLTAQDMAEAMADMAKIAVVALQAAFQAQGLDDPAARALAVLHRMLKRADGSTSALAEMALALAERDWRNVSTSAGDASRAN